MNWGVEFFGKTRILCHDVRRGVEWQGGLTLSSEEGEEEEEEREKEGSKNKEVVDIDRGERRAIFFFSFSSLSNEK